MRITVKRIAKKPWYTIGKLYIDGKYFCDTLEDTDRGLKQGDPLAHISRIKIHGQTAIPTGTYKITLKVKSPRFSKRAFYYNLCKGYLPRLVDVPGFAGVLIHVGNAANHTEGCILLGKNSEVGRLTESQKYITEFYKILQNSKTDITITIE